MSTKTDLLRPFFYLYEILLKVSCSVLVLALIQSFAVDVAASGLSTSCFYYAYAPSQLMAGFLIEIFVSKNLLTFAAFIFSLYILFLEAAWARFLLEFSSSFAFVAIVYVCFHWFSAYKGALILILADSLVC